MTNPLPPESSAQSLSDIIAAMLSAPTTSKRNAPKAQAGGKKANVRAEGAEKTVSLPTTAAWKLSTRWSDVAVILPVITTHCRNCNSVETASQPYLMLQRYHPHFGFHSEALTLHDPKHAELPRRLHLIEQEASFCRHCFLSTQHSLRQPPLFPEFTSQGVMRAAGGDILLDLFATSPSTGDGPIEAAGTKSLRVAGPQPPIPFNRSLTLFGDSPL